ncbi:MAG: family 43 glycosylhydrolase [Clostridia bacterium]|nr:family 43 glycosylhydrolase [Clostridia bacterium]
MKLKFNVSGKTQPDPFIFRDDDGKLYIYATGIDGIHAYSSDSLDGEWNYEGIILTVPRGDEYWAPSMIKLDGRYYLYFSYHIPGMFEHMHVAVSDKPLGPFEKPVRLYKRFTIDSHVVKTEAGLFLWYAEDNENCDRIGTRIFVDKLLDPFTPANICKEVIIPTCDEEITGQREKGPWHTVEGPFWFHEGEWQYVMYSAGAFTDDTYHIGYACAKSDEEDLTKVDFVKQTNDGPFNPVMFRNDVEEGVGHNSVIKIGDEYYAVYHARDIKSKNSQSEEYIEERTARFCKLNIKDGVITAEQK